MSAKYMLLNLKPSDFAPIKRASFALLFLSLTTTTAVSSPADAVDLNAHINLVDNQIDFDQSHGHLSRMQAYDLQNRLKSLHSSADNISSPGQSTSLDSSAAMYRLHAILDDLAFQRQKRSNVIDSFEPQIAKIEHLIAQAHACRQITFIERLALTAELQRLKNKHTDMLSEGLLTQKQADLLSRQTLSLHDRVIARMFYPHRIERGVAAIRLAPNN